MDTTQQTGSPTSPFHQLGHQPWRRGALRHLGYRVRINSLFGRAAPTVTKVITGQDRQQTRHSGGRRQRTGRHTAAAAAEAAEAVDQGLQVNDAMVGERTGDARRSRGVHKAHGRTAHDLQDPRRPNRDAARTTPRRRHDEPTRRDGLVYQGMRLPPHVMRCNVPRLGRGRYV